MIRIPENADNLTLTVVTIDGEVYADRDTTDAPFGQSERLVAFWDVDVLISLPMEQVKSVTLNFNEDS